MERVKRIRFGSEGLIYVGLILLGAISRLAAWPASPWEWDEIGFARALQQYDLSAHSPHPPGFPVLIALAKLARLLVQDDHLALVGVGFVFSCFLGAVLYALFREFQLDQATAFAGALLSCLAPAVVIGGTFGRSDSPALVAGLTVCWLALRGRRSDWALQVSALVLGLAAGIRVSVLPLAGVVLSLVLLGRVLERVWRTAGIPIILLAVGVLSWYLPVVQLTGWGEYHRILEAQSAFIGARDTIWSNQWSLDDRLSSFLLQIWGERWIALIFNGGAILGMAVLIWGRRWLTLGWMVASFVPVLAFTLSINSPTAAVVYSLPFIPFFTGLTAIAIVESFRLLFRDSQGSRLAVGTGVALTVGLAVALGAYTQPVARLIRRQASPPILAAEYLRRHLDPTRDKLYFDELLTQHAIYYFRRAGRSEIELLLPGEELSLNMIYPENRDFRQTLLLTTRPLPDIVAQRFRWPEGAGLDRLRPLSFGRYFDVYVGSVGPVQNIAWGRGWFEPEYLARQSWRWMGGQSRVGLFNESNRMRLRVGGQLPPVSGSLHLRLDGREIGVLAPQQVDFSLPIDVTAETAWSVLSLEVERTFVPRLNGEGSDERELGFKCFRVEWEPIESSQRRRFDSASFLLSGWGPLRIGQPRSWRTAKPGAQVRLPQLPVETGRLKVILRSIHPGTQIGIFIGERELETFTPSLAEITARDWSVDTRTCPARECLLTFKSTAGKSAAGGLAGHTSLASEFEVTSLVWRPE